MTSETGVRLYTEAPKMKIWLPLLFVEQFNVGLNLLHMFLDIYFSAGETVLDS